MQTKTSKPCARLLALLLALALMLSLLPISAMAAEPTAESVDGSTADSASEPDYELRVLTFEDADYKGSTNFAGKSDWSSLIDDPQYGGTMLYPNGSGTTDVSEAYTWTDANNTELTHTLPKSWDNYCYWGGGHAVSNYVSGDFTTYGNFNNQLTVYQKDTTGLKRTGGGHNGSNNFAVHFGYKDNSGYTDSQILPSFSFVDNKERVIDHMYINNICYAINCYLNGNDLTAKIDDSDWVKLTATGYNAAGTKTGEASIYLCNGPDNIIMDWTKFDLSGLGYVQKVEFNITGSSDNGAGFSQPAYFAYDDVAVRFEKEATNVPYLLDGVTDTAATVQTGKSYQLDDLMDGKIFGVAEGELTYKNYFYTVSSDGGATWSVEQGFEEALFGGVNKSLIQSVAGTYIYKFRAKNESGYSADTWTLTLTFEDVVEANVNFYIGRDQNYDTNGNIYPKLELYKTAGIDENQFDYVGWFTNGDGKTVYVYNPADYTIIDGETDYVEIDGVQYELHDYEKIEFTNSAFDASDETATASNTVVNNYNMFYATLSTGRYSTRGYGWNTETEAYDVYLGGQSLPLPMEKDIYGGGGNDIYLGVVSVYATTKNEKNEYFGVDDYHVEVIMPVTGSMIHSGAPYTYTRFSSNYTAFPFLSYEADNASLYNIYAYPTNTEKYMFNQKINNNTKHSYYVVTQSISIAKAVELEITAPTTADFTLFFQYNNFNTKAVEPYKDSVKNAETGMTTYFYRVSQGNSNYTWRLVDKTGTHVTKAGWLASLSQKTEKTEKTITFADGAPTDKKSHDTSKLGTRVSSCDEADLQVFLSHSGFKSVSDTYRVRAYRMWELINSDTANIMAEPDFRFQMLQGSDADVKQVSGGNAGGNWFDIKPTGTDIVAVTYDAIDMYSASDVAGTHGGFFPANNPERTGVFVITNEAAGKADATVVFNGGTASSRGAEWDYNYDTWYYLNTDTAPTLDFTVKAAEGVKVSYAVVTTSSALESTLSDWSEELTAGEDGTYHADLLPFRTANTLGGTVIIKMVDSTGTSYRLVRVAQMSVTVKNASNGGENIMPGDKVTLSFDGLYRGVDKVSGIFNPTQLYLSYSADEEEFKGSLGQYQQMDKTTVTVTLPTDITFADGEEKTTYNITGGYISGGMYSAASPFDTLYNMTDTGVGTNFSAVSISFVASRLADIPVEVYQKVYYNVKLVPVDENGDAIDGLTPTLVDGSNTAVTAEEDGTFKIGYGSYTYAVEQTGYVRTTGTFKLGSADAEKVENGVLTVKFTVHKAAENAWDGKAATEPATDEDGVYLIGTGAELAWFAQKVNGGSTSISGILTADIDLAGYEWTPIGTASKNFAGTFDGKDHTVDNLSINYSSTTTASLYRGLFGWAYGSTSSRVKIENLTVNGTVVAGSNKNVSDAYVGGIVGRADYADLTNLHSNVDVSIKRTGGNYQSVGGVVGGIYYSTNVTNCSNSGSITGWRYCAGIVGNISSGYQPSTITGCVNTGNVTAPSTCAAGIVSNLASNCKVTTCYNTGTIKAGGNYAAGIVGYAGKSEVTNCFNLGEIISNESFTYGSVIGIASDAAAVIKNLYYLDGSCVKGGIGSVKDEATQTATAKTAEEIANAEFVTAMNADLAEAAFATGCTSTNHPILLWQFAAEHSFTSAASDVIAKEATCTEAASYYVKCDNCDTVSTTLTVTVGEALGHSDYQYTDNGDGTHKVTCGVCSEVITASEAHVYVEGTCPCGATETPVVPKDENLKFLNVSLSLQECIQFTYMAKYTGVLNNYDSYYVAFSRNDFKDGLVENQDSGYKYSTRYHCFSYSVWSMQMNDEITATLYGVKDGVIYEGETVVKSVRDYVEEKFSAVNEATKLVYANMLQYGAMAQVNFAYDTENPVTTGLRDEITAYITTEAPATVNQTAATNNGLTAVKLAQNALGTQDAVKLQYVLNIGTSDINNLYAVATWVNEKGETVEKRYEGNQFTKQGKYYIVLVDGLNAVNGKVPVSLTVYDASTNAAVSETFTCSIQSQVYARQTATNNTTAKVNALNLMNALMNYYNACEALFG